MTITGMLLVLFTIEIFFTYRLENSLAYSILIMLAIGLVVWFLSAHSFNRLIFKPLRALREGAERLSNGDLSYQVTVTRRDEIGQVAEALNGMAARLQERDVELSEEIARRKEIAEQMVHGAMHDALTNLSNRTLLVDRLKHAILLNKRNPE